MIVVAETRDPQGLVYTLRVHTNLWSILNLPLAHLPFRTRIPLLKRLHFGPALKVRAYQENSTEYREGVIKYPTISDFINEFEVTTSKRHNIRIPRIKRVHLLGNLAGKFFAKLGIYPTKDCGCPSRKEWWNKLVAFVPMNYGRE